MVALYGCSGNGQRLDAVGIDGALAQPFHIGDFVGLLVEYVDESFADNLAFLFGVGHSGEFLEEFCRCVDSYHVQAESLVISEHVGEFVFAQHSVVNEYAGEVLADGLVEKHGGH